MMDQQPFLLNNIQAYESFEFSAILNKYRDDFKREFGESKYRKINEKIMQSRSIRDLIEESFRQKAMIGGKNLIETTLSIPFFMLAKPETIAMGSIIALERWNTTINEKHVVPANVLKEVIHSVINLTWEMKFKR